VDAQLEKLEKLSLPSEAGRSVGSEAGKEAKRKGRFQIVEEELGEGAKVCIVCLSIGAYWAAAAMRP
jgi:hypothetical protein